MFTPQAVMYPFTVTIDGQKWTAAAPDIKLALAIRWLMRFRAFGMPEPEKLKRFIKGRTVAA